MKTPVLKKIQNWTLTNHEGNFDLDAHTEDYEQQIYEPDKMGDVLIEHDGCHGRDGCATSTVWIPMEVLVEFVRANGYKVEKEQCLPPVRHEVLVLRRVISICCPSVVESSLTQENTLKNLGTEKLSVTATVELTWENVHDLLCSAFEGGSNYWYMIEEFHMPPELKGVPKEKVFRHLDYPCREGGYIVVSDSKVCEDEGGDVTKRKIDRPRLIEALQLMSTKYPRHFADFLQGGGDACTGDVFLQLAVLGDVVYG